MTPAPDLLVPSPDGTPIAVFRSGRSPGDAPTLLLVHGAAADHTTWRMSGPLLGEAFAVAAIDRRGRGASGDGPDYGIEREFEDVAAVADALAAECGAPVAVVGHSFGGRVALGAAIRSASISHVVCYEGAPPPQRRSFASLEHVAALDALLHDNRLEELLVGFLRDVVGMSTWELDAYRANPVWPARVAAAGTIPREIRAGASPEAALEALSSVAVPVLQVLGSASRPEFESGARALDEQLRDGRILVVDGAAHAAHHTHPQVFVAAVSRFVAVP